MRNLVDEYRQEAQCEGTNDWMTRESVRLVGCGGVQVKIVDQFQSVAALLSAGYAALASCKDAPTIAHACALLAVLETDPLAESLSCHFGDSLLKPRAALGPGSFDVKPLPSTLHIDRGFIVHDIHSSS